MNNNTLQTQQSKEQYCIYMHTCIGNDNGYIGKTVEGLDKRWLRHRYITNSGSDTHFHKAIRKYGVDSFKGVVLYIAFEKDDDHLYEVEEQLIADWDTFHNGYNMNPGGKGSSSGEDSNMWGKQHTTETKSAMSRAHSGKNHHNYDSTIRTFEHKGGDMFIGTKFHLREKYNLNQSHLSAVILGKRKTTGGWKLL